MGGDDASAQRDGDNASARELKALLTQRERELQVHRWRGQAESDSLLAQETLMVSCFHKLGIEYNKLRLRYEDLERRLSSGVDGRAGLTTARQAASPPSRSAGGTDAAKQASASQKRSPDGITP